MNEARLPQSKQIQLSSFSKNQQSTGNLQITQFINNDDSEEVNATIDHDGRIAEAGINGSVIKAKQTLFGGSEEQRTRGHHRNRSDNLSIFTNKTVDQLDPSFEQRNASINRQFQSDQDQSIIHKKSLVSTPKPTKMPKSKFQNRPSQKKKKRRCLYLYRLFCEPAHKKQRRKDRAMRKEVLQLERSAGDDKIERIQHLWKVARSIYFTTRFLKISKDSITKKQVKGSSAQRTVFEQESIAPFIIMPDNKFKLFWDTGASFKLQPLHRNFDLELAIDIIMIFDQALRFFTAYYQDKKLVHKPSKLFKNYLTSFFLIDCLANMPYIFLEGSRDNLYYFKFFRVLKMSWMFDNIEKIIKMAIQRWSKLKQAQILDWFSFLKFLVYIFLIMHFEACLFVFLGVDFNDSWIQQLGYENYQNIDVYIASLYTVQVTFCTVGYGDIHAYTTIEYLYFMQLELVGISVFSMLMRRVQDFTQNKSTDVVAERMEGLETWLLSLNRVAKKTQSIRTRDIRTIQKFFEIYYKKSPSQFLEHEFYKDLSIQAKNKLIKEITRPYRKKFKFFFSDYDHGFKANNVFIRDIMANLYLQIYEPNKTIIAFKDEVNELSFVYQGQVIVSDKNTGLTILKFQEGSYIGDFQILMNIRSNYNFSSCDSINHKLDCHLMCISAKKFEYILKDHPIEAKFLELRAKKRYLHLKRMRNKAREEEVENAYRRRNRLIHDFGSKNNPNEAEESKAAMGLEESITFEPYFQENTNADLDNLGQKNANEQEHMIEELPDEDDMDEAALLMNLEISDDEQKLEHFQKEKLLAHLRITTKKFDRVQSQFSKLNSLAVKLNETIALSCVELNNALTDKLIRGTDDKLQQLHRTMKVRHSDLIQEIEYLKSRNKKLIDQQTIELMKDDSEDGDCKTSQTSSIKTDTSMQDEELENQSELDEMEVEEKDLEDINNNEENQDIFVDDDEEREKREKKLGKSVSKVYAIHHIGSYKKKAQVQLENLKKINYFRDLYLEKKEKKRSQRRNSKLSISKNAKKTYFGGPDGQCFGINSPSSSYENWSLRKDLNSIQTSLDSQNNTLYNAKGKQALQRGMSEDLMAEKEQINLNTINNDNSKNLNKNNPGGLKLNLKQTEINLFANSDLINTSQAANKDEEDYQFSNYLENKDNQFFSQYSANKQFQFPNNAVQYQTQQSLIQNPSIQKIQSQVSFQESLGDNNKKKIKDSRAKVFAAQDKFRASNDSNIISKEKLNTNANVNQNSQQQMNKQLGITKQSSFFKQNQESKQQIQDFSSFKYDTNDSMKSNANLLSNENISSTKSLFFNQIVNNQDNNQIPDYQQNLIKVQDQSRSQPAFQNNFGDTNQYNLNDTSIIDQKQLLSPREYDDLIEQEIINQKMIDGLQKKNNPKQKRSVLKNIFDSRSKSIASSVLIQEELDRQQLNEDLGINDEFLNPNSQNQQPYQKLKQIVNQADKFNGSGQNLKALSSSKIKNDILSDRTQLMEKNKDKSIEDPNSNMNMTSQNKQFSFNNIPNSQNNQNQQQKSQYPNPFIDMPSFKTPKGQEINEYIQKSLKQQQKEQSQMTNANIQSKINRQPDQFQY